MVIEFPRVTVAEDKVEVELFIVTLLNVVEELPPIVCALEPLNVIRFVPVPELKVAPLFVKFPATENTGTPVESATLNVPPESKRLPATEKTGLPVPKLRLKMPPLCVKFPATFNVRVPPLAKFICPVPVFNTVRFPLTLFVDADAKFPETV